MQADVRSLTSEMRALEGRISSDIGDQLKDVMEATTKELKHLKASMKGTNAMLARLQTKQLKLEEATKAKLHTISTKAQAEAGLTTTALRELRRTFERMTM